MRIKPFSLQELRRRIVLKWAFFVIIIILAYLYATVDVGGLPKPHLLIPIALCIAMTQSEMTAAMVGLVCGLLIDAAGGKLFGFNAFLLMAFCMLTALLFLHLCRQNVLNLIWVTFVGTLIQGSLDFFFFYAIWGYDGVARIFSGTFLPSMIFTVVASPIIYFVVKLIEKKFGLRQSYLLDEKADNVTRE